ncbi:hypothetical protein MTR_7g035360 [Medicago truncatula]|uniref:Uncharacterized protein n=1 Tax=Medicago truncatula TaxID=3880 RepID=A0A072U8V3_MEDTR|nr:hypothetical protein MTR_7g035360 [Medicago truncatula]
MKNDYPDRLKPTRAIYAKVKDYDKVTASDETSLTWGTLGVRSSPISKQYRQWNSKLLENVVVIMFNVPSPY